MLPQFYQTVLRSQLSESQYLTLELLILLIQTQRQVSLASLANAFPQPIQYPSRLRHLQRFLRLPQLSIKLLWFPLIKYWVRQEFKGRNLNRAQRRRRKKLKHQKSGYLVVAIDRTQWKGRNLFIIGLVWGHHALPVYWQLLQHSGNSNLRQQQTLLQPVLQLLKPYPVVVVADREFHSPKLAMWLAQRKVSFALRQKKNAYIQQPAADYQALNTLGFRPGMSQFFLGISCGKQDQLGPFNLAVYWKRQYRTQAPKDPWYILTNLPTLSQTLAIYKSRWGIEQMFKDCKTGGYNLEDTKTSDERFLALVLIIAIAYTLATCQGTLLQDLRIQTYLGRLQEHHRPYPRHSQFWLGLSAHRWCYAMEIWSSLVHELLCLKPHKRLYFQRGLLALSQIHSTFSPLCHP